MTSFAILLNQQLEPIYQIPTHHMEGEFLTEFIIHGNKLFRADPAYSGPRPGFKRADWVYVQVDPLFIYNTQDYYKE